MDAIRVALGALFLPAWAVLGVITAVLSIPSVPTLVVYLTFGLGLGLMIVPTLFVYATAMLPGAIVFLARGPWWVALPVAAIGPLVVAVAPASVGASSVAGVRARLAADERSAELPDAPRALRIVTWQGTPRRERPLDSARCDELCQRLLYDDEVDAVEVHAIERDGPGLSVTYRREAREGCPPAFSGARALPRVARAIAIGDCLVPRVDEVLPAASWIRVRHMGHTERQRVARDGRWQRASRITIATAGPPGSDPEDPPWRHYGLRTKVVTRPLVLAPETDHPTHLDLEWWAAEQAWGPIDAIAAAREAFGYRLAEGEAGDPVDVPPPDLELVARILDQTGTEPFDASQEALIREALQRRQVRRHGALSPDEIETVARVLRDPRVHDAFFAVQIAEDDVAARETLVPAVIDRFTLPVPPNQPHTHGRAAHFLLELPSGEVAPHAERIEAAIRADGGWGTSGLLTALPRWLDPPPLDLIERAVTHDHRTVRRDGILAACNVEAGRVPAPLLRSIVEVGRTGDVTERAAAVRALRHHGTSADEEAVLAGLDARERERIERRVEGFAGPDGGCR